MEDFLTAGLGSYQVKRSYDNLVRAYKKEIMSFERFNDQYDRTIFGAELPNVNNLTKSTVFEILGNIYTTTHQSFVFFDEQGDGNDDLLNYSELLKNKLDNTFLTAFLPSLKQHIEDAVILGLGVSFIYTKDKETRVRSIKPENFHYDLDSVTGEPSNLYIIDTLYQDKKGMQMFSDYSYYSEHNCWNVRIFEVKKKDNKWVLKTWIKEPEFTNNYKDVNYDIKSLKQRYPKYKNIVVDEDKFRHLSAKDKSDFTVYYKADEIKEFDYNPIVYTRFGVKSGEHIGLGIGLESLPLLREIKLLYNRLREVVDYETKKPVILPDTALSETNNAGTSLKQNLPMTTSMVAPVIKVRSDQPTETHIRPFNWNLELPGLLNLIDRTNQKINENFDLDAYVINRGSAQMSSSEVKVRDEKGKFQIELYISELKQSVDYIIRIFFHNYRSKLKGYKFKAFDYERLLLAFQARSERELSLQKLSDLSTFVGIETQIIANSQQLNLNSDQILQKLNDIATSLNLAHLSINTLQDPTSIGGF